MNPEALSELREAFRLARTSAEKRRVAGLIQDLEWIECSRDPWRFIVNHCVTHDEHETKRPFRKLDRNKLYLEQFVRVWQESQYLLVPKSRQIMISWICVLLILWHCTFHKGQLALIQSKREEDAGKMIARLTGVWERLPAWMRERVPAKTGILRVEFTAQKSIVLGVPEGGSIVRSNTPSLFFSDESAFQPEFAAAFAAALPAVQGGGRMMCVSSAKAGPFFDLCDSPMIPGSKQILIPSWSEKQGMVHWKTEMDLDVLQIHYSADPSKNQAWAESDSRRFRGGMKGSDWQAEMEIDPGARAGQRVFPIFSRATHVIEPFEWEEFGWPLFVGIDPGYATRCAVVFVTLDGDGSYYVVDELYMHQAKVPAVASAIKAKLGRKRPQFIMIGHDAFAGSQKDGSSTLADQFAAEGLPCEPSYFKKSTWIPLVADLIDLMPNGKPRLMVFETCPNTAWELNKFRYAELSELQTTRRDLSEEPMPKDDHLIHALRNVLASVSDDYLRRYGIVDPLEEVKLKTVSERMHDKVAALRRSSSGGMWDD